MSKSQLVALILVVILGLGVTGVFWHANHPAPITRDVSGGAKITRDISDGAKITRDLSGGAKIQRQRIDRVIASTESLSIDKAIAELANRNEAYDLIGLAAMSPSSRYPHYMSKIVADRRVSKIVEYLDSLSQSKAAQVSEEIFDSQFAKFLAEWKRLSSSRGRANTGPTHHAASVGLFLCSCYCSPQVLNKKISLWRKSLSDESFEQIDGVSLLVESRFIDRLFHLNLLVISGFKAGESIEELDKKLKKASAAITDDSRQFLQVTNLSLFRWNAETLTTDFTYVTRGVPASVNSILSEFPGFADPNSSRFLRDEDVFKHLLQIMEEWQISGRKK